MILNKDYYLSLFGIGERELEELTALALRGGGNYADLYFESSTDSSLLLRDGIVGSGGYSVDYGCGIRVLAGEKTGYAYSESTEMNELRLAASSAAAIGQGNVAVTRPSSGANRFFGKPNPAADRYPMKADWRSADLSACVTYLEKLEAKIRALEPRTVKVLAYMGSSVSDVMMYNSLGELKYETRPLASIQISLVLQQGTETRSQRVSRSYRMGTEFLSEELLDSLAAEAVDGVDQMFEAKRAKGGKMSVVMAAGASGILLHEAMGHAFEADFNRKGQSIFSDKMGSRVCRKGITIVDDGTIHGNRGSINFDDEGVPGQRTCMVEDGILTSYLHDRISADYYGVAPTGNGRRESFRYHPIPRMRVTYMENGDAGSAEDIISGVKKGIFVSKFANGEVKIGEGDFTFFVKSGFLIENGRLTMPVKDINIIGNGPKALADIVAVGSDLKIDDSTWTCGKEQSCYVSCGIPTVLVKELTVGGE